MAADPDILAPEVEELLREIASDPRSSLLRAPRPELVRGLLERTPRERIVSDDPTGATAAERHLLSVHREEVAALLREAALLRIFDDPGADGAIGREVSASERIELPDEEVWRARARGEVEANGDDAAALHGHELLVRCAAREGESRPTTSQLAAAALRLAPHDSARIYVGVDLIQRDEPRAALRVLRNVIAGCPSPINLSNAWENVGWALSECELEGEAVVAYERASAIGEPRSTSIMSWLLLSLKLGDKDRALAAAGHLDSIFPADHESISPYLDTVAANLREMAWRPSRECTSLLRSCSDSLGPASKRVADVLG